MIALALLGFSFWCNAGCVPEEYCSRGPHYGPCNGDEIKSDGSGGHQPKDQDEPPKILPPAICLVSAEGPEVLIGFVTSFQLQGDIGDLEVADQHCNDAATAGDLPGHYFAWLSDAKTGLSPRTREDVCPLWSFKGAFHSTRHVDYGGPQVLAEGWNGLSKKSMNGLFYDEYGQPAPSGAIWSNTDSSGKLIDGNDCEGWSSAEEDEEGWTGTNGARDFWSANRKKRCNEGATLLCIQKVGGVSLKIRG